MESGNVVRFYFKITGKFAGSGRHNIGSVYVVRRLFNDSNNEASEAAERYRIHTYGYIAWSVLS